jgi:hypothetical protein
MSFHFPCCFILLKVNLYTISYLGRTTVLSLFLSIISDMVIYLPLLLYTFNLFSVQMELQEGLIPNCSMKIRFAAIPVQWVYAFVSR